MKFCHDKSDLLNRYVGDDLSFGERLRVHYHLGLCRPCRQYLRRLRTASAAHGVEQTGPPSDELRNELLSRFK